MDNNTPVKADDSKKKPVAKIWPLSVIKKNSAGETDGNFLPGSENPRTIVRKTMWVLLIFFGIFGVGSFFAHISGAVVAQGRVKFESERKVVQHLEGGIVEKILVHEGQQVKEGEPLVVLESVSVDANANMLTAQLLDLELRRVRSLAEKDGKRSLEWPQEIKELAARLNNMDKLANEEKIFLARLETVDTQVGLLKTQLAQLQAQIRGFEDQARAENSIIATLREELGAKRKMLKEHFIDKPQILELERQLASHEGTRGHLRQSIAEAKQRGAETNLRIVDVLGRFTSEATETLGATEKELIQTREQVRPLVDARKRLQITAPVTGKVVDLKIHSVGGVIAPGAVLMDIVPEDHPLIIETRIAVDDITDVYVSQPAQIHLTAFDYRTTPKIPGEVTYLSADALDDNGLRYYLCYVEVDRQALKDADIYIAPGMSATVYLKTRERTIFYYMFEPLFIQWEKSLRD